MVSRPLSALSFCGIALALASCASSPETARNSHSGHTVASRSQGYYKVGSAYEVNGVWYHPTVDWDYDKTGTASWYGEQFHGRYTANGEIFDLNGLTAAHPTLPLPTIVEVTNLENGRSLTLRVNDRGPYVNGRLIDVSRRAAQLLGFEVNGTTRVRVRVLKQETEVAQNLARHGQSGTMLAAAPVHGKAWQETVPAPVVFASTPGQPNVQGVPPGAPKLPPPLPAGPIVVASAPIAVSQSLPPLPAPPLEQRYTAPAPQRYNAPAPYTAPAAPVIAATVLPPPRYAPPPMDARAEPEPTDDLPRGGVLRPPPPTTFAALPPREAPPPMQPRPEPRRYPPAFSYVPPPPLAGSLPPRAPERRSEPVFLASAGSGQALDDPRVPPLSRGAGFAPPRYDAPASYRPMPAMSSHPRAAESQETPIYVQAGAFSEAQNAQRLKARLEAFGNVRVSDKTINGVPLYLVRIGPVASLDEADRLRAQVAGHGIPGARVTTD